MSDQNHPGVIAPPPLIFAGFLLAGYGLHAALKGPGTYLQYDQRFALAAVFGGVAMAFIFGALGLFRQAGTAARPWKESTKLVTGGVYRITRNPMYVGMALLHFAIGLALDSVFVLAALVPAVIVIDQGVIKREERYLEAKFGEDFTRYKAAVRRWI